MSDESNERDFGLVPKNVVDKERAAKAAAKAAEVLATSQAEGHADNSYASRVKRLEANHAADVIKFAANFVTAEGETISGDEVIRMHSDGNLVYVDPETGARRLVILSQAGREFLAEHGPQATFEHIADVATSRLARSGGQGRQIRGG